MKTYRKIAIIVGVLFIIGTVAGILSAVFLNPILGDPDYLAKTAENKNQVIIGVLFVLTMGLALAMVPVTIFPVLKKHNETLAVGYVVFRGGLETVTYILLAISQLALIPLSQEYIKAGTSGTPYFQAIGNLLMGVQNSVNNILIIVFCLGALMFYSLLYRSKLTPRWLSGWGLVAILLHFSTSFLLMFAIIEDWSPILMGLNLLILLQEMVMAVWLIVKGFNPSAIAFGYAKTDIN